ncbi:MAG TPA: hypothetical protein PLY99_11965 [Acidovorax temperans]|nr:hypothetical protein [Acidovorax temperans]
MVFKARKDNGGQIDSAINTRGRPLKKDEKTLTRREAKDKEMLTLARKLKPGAQVALKEALKILNNDKASEAAKLKAAEIYLKYFHLTVDKLYQPSGADELPEDQVEVTDVQPDGRPVFSLRMVSNPEDI